MRKLIFTSLFLLSIPVIGLSQDASLNAMISPNPARNYCEISTSVPVELRVLDMQGKVLIEMGKARHQDVDLTMIPEGIYFVHLIGENQVQTLRLVRSEK
ncbi:T9SS type A sorting domain-containing protein [Sanyastnella coralliicola]|uniref:T9SS type A sorting domain-containing protein n=1 Tax=Sanyastnella coralliicola TaxID=3069118 RepID=UPI0027BAB894|nr:T9SS type A sorting domain-containing protein [Longitalea sp. SCSIO 12813]